MKQLKEREHIKKEQAEKLLQAEDSYDLERMKNFLMTLVYYASKELWAGEVTSSKSDSPGSDSPGSDSPGSDSPGSDSPGSDSPGSSDESAEKSQEERYENIFKLFSFVKDFLKKSEVEGNEKFYVACWYKVALIDTIEYFPTEVSSYKNLIRLFIKAMKLIDTDIEFVRKYKDEDVNSYKFLLSYVIMKGVRMGFVNRKYQAVGI